jgi:hypothetical protein
MWANIKISPVARSLAMAGIKPSLANFGRNVVVFSISSGLPEHVDGVEGGFAIFGIPWRLILFGGLFSAARITVFEERAVLRQSGNLARRR